MEIRLATAEDYDCVCSLVFELDRLQAERQPQFFRLAGDPVRSRELFEKEIAPAFSGVFLAFEGTDPVGFVSFLALNTYDYQTIVPRRLLMIRNFVITSARIRKGIGRSLMAAAKDWAIANHCDAMDLT